MTTINYVQPHLKSFGTSGPNSRGSPFCFAILIFETVVRESCNVSIAVIPVNKLSMRECYGCWWATIHEQLNIVGCQYFSNAAVQLSSVGLAIKLVIDIRVLANKEKEEDFANRE
jgi:hypothetical protein